ncbi:MAG: PLP-dependent transferase [Thermodesulfobacteriota bacterium]|nr:PLP-dependent transferase [Thermodesulfobacteriota bacterium]
MDKRYYEPIPCGANLPLDNPHAFSVSMPTYQDVVDFEEGKSAVFDLIKTAYPRLQFHPYVNQVAEFIRVQKSVSASCTCFVLPSMRFAEDVAGLSATTPEIYAFDGYAIAVFSPEATEAAANYFAFMKHTGYMIYSREAEDFLRSRGIELPEWDEDYNCSNPQEQVVATLHQGYGDADITLCGSGMNAIYAAYAAVKENSAAGRDIFIQYGWIYTDSIHILRKCSNEFHQIGRVTDLAALKRYLQENGDRVAGIITETLSNPLLQTPDLPVLAELARQYQFTIIIDNTFATPWNVDVTPYADIVVESLTKFAAGKGDCMAGAVIIPAASQLPAATRQSLQKFVNPLAGRDLQRLGATIGGYQERVKQANGNAAVLVDYLERHPQVKVVHHAYADTGANYGKMTKGDGCYGGVISFVVNGDFASFYDNLTLPKGPSLGCDFPLAMSYTLLAHWDLVNDPKQKVLNDMGISPWLIRLSVGEDSPQLIIAAMEKAFKVLSAD